MRAEAVLIDVPERQHPARRALFAIVTLAAWMAWASLWLPLLTLLAWMFGLRVGYIELAVREHGHGGQDLLVLLALAAACSLVMTTWSSYNYLRFAQQKRRHQSITVPWPAMANKLGVHLHTAAWMQDASRMVLEFPDDGRVCIAWEMPSSGELVTARQ